MAGKHSLNGPNVFESSLGSVTVRGKGQRSHTAGCTYVKRSGSGDGVLDGIQPDITEES